MLFSFADIEFPSFMMELPQFQPVAGRPIVGRPTHDEYISIMSDSRTMNGYEYASDKTYLKFFCGKEAMFLTIIVRGQPVVEHQPFTDFSEVKDTIRRYS